MKKFLFLILLIVLVVAGCQEEVLNDQPIEKELTEEVSNEDIENEEVESDKLELESAEVSLGGKVTITEEAIIVDGESNLLEGTVVQATRYRQPFTIRPLICVACGSESTSVNEDGSFYFEFPLPGESFEQTYIELALEVKMPYLQREEVTSLYGEKGELMEGPFIYPYGHSGETRYKAYAPIYILIGGEEMEYSIEAPDMKTPPSDYGEPEVWVETDVTNDHRYIYVEGNSNLLAGTNVRAVYYSSEAAVLPQYWFSSEAYVRKDGTFLLRIPYDSITDEGFIEFSMWSDFGHEAPTEIADVYGENFVHIKGAQVIEDEEGRKGIELMLNPTFPEIEYTLPEESMITTDGDETKIQLPDNVLFDYGEDVLREEAAKMLDEFLESLEDLDEGTVIEINGHTDNTGGNDFNQILSEERAATVKSYLQENGDIDHLTIETAGYGKDMPIASNEDALGRGKNRRVEFVINPN